MPQFPASADRDRGRVGRSTRLSGIVGVGAPAYGTTLPGYPGRGERERAEQDPVHCVPDRRRQAGAARRAVSAGAGPVRRPAFEVVARIVHRGRAVPPFTLDTLPLPQRCRAGPRPCATRPAGTAGCPYHGGSSRGSGGGSPANRAPITSWITPDVLACPVGNGPVAETSHPASQTATLSAGHPATYSGGMTGGPWTQRIRCSDRPGRSRDRVPTD